MKIEELVKTLSLGLDALSENIEKTEVSHTLMLELDANVRRVNAIKDEVNEIAKAVKLLTLETNRHKILRGGA
jgi:hypothetical protein